MAVLHLNDQDFDQTLEQAPLILVDFWAEWCGPCKMLGPVIEELAADYDGRGVAIAKVNVDQCQELAVRFGVMSIPTVLLFQNGQEVQRLVGLLPKERYTGLIDAALRGQ